MLDIIHILTGAEPAPPSLDSMVKLYLEKTKFDFENAIWWAANYLPEGSAQKAAEMYESLPDQVRVHLLLSPAMYEHLHTFRGEGTSVSREEAFARLTAMVSDELSIVRGEPASPLTDAKEFWSSMGDVGLRRSEDGGWTRVDAPRLDSIVVLDFDSPYARMLRPQSSTMRLPPEDFTPEERASVLGKCEEAFAYISRVSPTFAHLIRNYTRAVRFRKADKMQGISSEHVTSTIGEIRLLNMQKSAVELPKVVEQLIHESVHNMLSTYEYTQEAFLHTADTKQHRPTSLWTGNPLPIASFTHAIFVWFSLFNFALLESKQPNLSDEQMRAINERRNRYACGFVGPTRLSDYIRTDITFSSTLFPAIDIAQDTVIQNLMQIAPEAAIA